MIGLQRWLIDEARDKMGETINPLEWEMVTRKKDVPKQFNGVDCGVFTIICADFLSDDLPLEYKHTQMEFFREKIGTDIIRGKLLYPDVTIRKDDLYNSKS